MANATTKYYRHFIRAGDATIIVSRASSGTNTVNYVTQDHLGSSSVMTYGTGTVLLNSSFGAYGARRGSNWPGVPTTLDWTNIANTSRRGFTDHTMLDNVGLIHMNGRVYDPVIGRLASADPNIDGAASSQGYNRYTYAMNRPLSGTDPTGFGFWSNLATRISSCMSFGPDQIMADELADSLGMNLSIPDLYLDDYGNLQQVLETVDVSASSLPRLEIPDVSSGMFDALLFGAGADLLPIEFVPGLTGMINCDNVPVVSLGITGQVVGGVETAGVAVSRGYSVNTLGQIVRTDSVGGAIGPQQGGQVATGFNLGLQLGQTETGRTGEFGVIVSMTDVIGAEFTASANSNSFSYDLGSFFTLGESRQHECP